MIICCFDNSYKAPYAVLAVGDNLLLQAKPVIEVCLYVSAAELPCSR